MMNSKQLNLNLAFHPWRNRRLFFVLIFFLGAIFLLVSFFAGKTFIQYHSKAQQTKASIRKTERMIRDTQKDEKQLGKRIEETVKSLKGRVEVVNSIILKKSFSWIEFFSDLEKSLPDSSYIISLAPSLTEKSKMLLNLRVASSNVDDLLKLIDNLTALKFGEIKILGETQNDRGLLISEISLSYERDI
jgi:cell division protein FtsB